MKAIENLYLAWRAGKGESRIAVGIIRKNQTEGACFSYIEGVEKAKDEGFVPYTEFPDTDTNKIYTENIIEIFGQRLNKSERADIQKYYDFWEITPDHKTDKYYLLAHTQGMLSTDNFEFLADYNPIENLKFISEICGLSINKLPSNILSEGDELQWEYDKDNPYDKKAVSIFKDSKYLGNIKLIHCNVFSKLGGNRLKIKVKNIDKNGSINRVFVTVHMPCIP